MRRGVLCAFCVIVLLMLAACQAETAPPAALPTTAPSSTAAPTSTQAAPTLSPSATDTPEPSAEPTVTPAPSLTSTATPLACLGVGGTFEFGTLEADFQRHALDFRVYLPPCYAELPDLHYPVLYLIHGQSYNDDQWDRLGTDEAADRLMAAGEIAPFIIVMPRDREWSQSNQDPFGRGVIELLLPHIDATYRTLPERQFRAVGGLSRGASWAIHFGLKYWELFGAVGAHSPPVFWSDVAFIKLWLNEIPAEQMPRFYMDIGEDDRQEIMESAVWFEKLLAERNIPHEWYMFAGYHEEAYWQAHVEQYLRWYSQPWR
jgi:enterochelin esterase-like enzyme